MSSVISSALNPKSNEKTYQFHIRLQCEFKRHLHLPLKGKKFQWEIVGFTQGEGVTDLDGRAVVSLNSAIDPTFINIYYQDKKYRFGAYDNVVVNIQDCEI
ncbi:hypothetical protein [Bdellovibrio sp. HCB209]|uniref:hypothetical protein n=1 Tax=Bdellovibrio sp. HCB209 TaxID=3394354 RepID=UPI0039B3977B